MNFPHIKYVPTAYQYKSKIDRTLYYLGGEPEENNSILTFGKIYEIRTVLFSESADQNRKSVWICSDDENKGKVCQIDPKNFGTFSDLRDLKLKKIVK